MLTLFEKLLREIFATINCNPFCAVFANGERHEVCVCIFFFFSVQKYSIKMLLSREKAGGAGITTIW